MKNKTFNSYLSGLHETNDTNYSLWKLTRRIKYLAFMYYLSKKRARSEQDKANVYVPNHVFKSNDIVSELNIIQC